MSMKNSVFMNGEAVTIDKIFEMYSVFNTVYQDLNDYIEIFGDKIEYVIERAFTTEDYLLDTGDGLATAFVNSLLTYHSRVSNNTFERYGFVFDEIIEDGKHLKDGLKSLKTFVEQVKTARDIVGDYIKKIIDNIDHLDDL